MLAAGSGIGAVAIGMLVGYLVNGPPQRPLVSHVVADSSPAAPSDDDGVQAGTGAARAPEAPEAPEVPAAPPPAAAAPDASAAAAQMPTAEVRELQSRLRAMGFNPGPVDGVVGPLTENAAQQYQRARGLEVTGAVDSNLLAQLRQEPPPPLQPSPPRHAAKSYAGNTAVAQQRPRSPFDEFLDNLDRLFRR